MVINDGEGKWFKLEQQRDRREIYTTKRPNVTDLQDMAGKTQAYRKDHKSVSASRPGVDDLIVPCSRRHAVPDN
jgi:hypothetical protein